ncbi:MAG: methylenetetrahydrofolate--tRNA-(uracil(54)-C(5))-methyltransferase (FADH(2)-oxidizing) TrmFO [Clostridiales bacterium]|jgi:methylenetetrahydrofolate--tRNA-(uracil-5-)-methyltransferase|nr:methylenetetrahydrofolate--tRNA-(uracil(54)-C(5))-methyltransferase (FADH(2)-oxidizing) TrmFO [Clostridiales bacterium]
MKKARVIGAGLAGCEAAYQLLKGGAEVELFEMRPHKKTPAHVTGDFAELVCSNSLKSEDVFTSSGLLKREMELMDSLILRCANAARIPSGSALAVDKERFSEAVQRGLARFSKLTVVRRETEKIENVPQIIATGPLTDGGLMDELQKLTGGAAYFFDAAAPIVSAESIDYERAFFQSRYGKGGDGGYLNCPLDKDEYGRFYEELIAAECAEIRDFEERAVFSGCMPVEIMAKRGRDTLRFGPMRPVGIRGIDGKRPYAVVQLRRENAGGTMYNLVGFQTHLKFGEQKRVFSLIPALKNAEFLRFGVMHRNSYVLAPAVLKETFALKAEGYGHIFIAGQLSGVEGYVESAASGLVAAKNMLRILPELSDAQPFAPSKGTETGMRSHENIANAPQFMLSRETVSNISQFMPPPETMTGALCRHIAYAEAKDFQPMNSNFGLLPPLEKAVRDKKKRKEEYVRRAGAAMDEYIKNERK